MVRSVAVWATASPESDPATLRLEHYARIVGYVIAGYFGILFLGLAILLVFCAVMFLVLRLNGPDSPFTRRVVARLVARTAHDTTHRSDERGDPTAIAKGLQEIRSRDEHFDEQVVLEAARRALFFAFVAGLDGDDRRLRQVATNRFWRTPAGETVREQAQALERRQAAAANHPEYRSLRPMPLDYDAHEAELWAVAPDVDGIDHVTVRLAFRGEGALAGIGAEQLAKTLSGHIELSAMRNPFAASRPGAPTAAPRPPAAGSARVGNEGWYDFDFVRPTSARTSSAEGVGARQCSTCGAPYRSDLDVACRNCHTERPTVAGGWLLDASWLVVDTGAHAGEGLNRARHDAGWALRGAGNIAVRVAAGVLDS